MKKPSDYFIELMIDFLYNENFTYIKSKNKFVKQFDAGYFIFETSFLSSRKEVTFYYGIHFEKIDKIVAECRERKYDKTEYTIFISLSNLVDDVFDVRFEIETEAEVKQAIEKTKELYFKYAKPYYSENNNLLKLQELYKKFIYEKAIGNNKYHGSLPDNMLKSLIVNKLLDDRDYKELELEYKSKLKNYANGFYIQTFDKCVEILCQRQLE